MSYSNNEIEVKAHKIDSIHIYYECPQCWTKYKKNDEPYKNAKHQIHKHGSGNKLNNRIEYRISHCPSRLNVRYTAKIIIDDSTQKINP
jgi:hypothetical protein